MDECLHSCKNAGCMTTSLCGWLCSLSLCERINAYSSRPASVRSKMSASALEMIPENHWPHCLSSANAAYRKLSWASLLPTGRLKAQGSRLKAQDDRRILESLNS